MSLVTILFVEQEPAAPREWFVAPNAPGTRPFTGKEQVVKDLVEGDAERPVTQYQSELPSSTEAQIRQAVALIPSNYSKLNRWTCRLEGHSTDNCR